MRRTDEIILAVLFITFLSGCGKGKESETNESVRAARDTNITTSQTTRDVNVSEPSDPMENISEEERRSAMEKDETEEENGEAEGTQTFTPVVDEDGFVSAEIFAMDTYMTLMACDGDAVKAVQSAVEEIERLDDLLSTGKEESEISRLNREGSGKVTEDTEYLINRALGIWKDTDGAFNIAVYPLMELWGFPTEEYRIPSDDELSQALSLADPSKITLDCSSHTVTFQENGMGIDLGGIAKGYAGSRMADIFREHGVTSGILNLGGNVQTIGSKKNGKSWRIAIKDPEKDGEYLGILEISDFAVITSGGYERYFEKDGKIYHHILDPETGKPAEKSVKSASIICEDGTLADALSTSFFIMGKDKAAEYWRQSEIPFDFILEDDEGDLYISEDIKDNFSSSHSITVIRKEEK